MELILGLVVSPLLKLHELWADERLTLEKSYPRYTRPRRPNSAPAVPLGPGIDIWPSCRFAGALMRSLCTLPGGLGRFIPCAIGANHCRLRHIGWERCGDGLTSRPRESASDAFLNELLQLFRCPPGSVPTLLCWLLCFLGIALYGLQVRSLLGVCQFLGMLLTLSLPRVVWRMLLGL